MATRVDGEAVEREARRGAAGPWRRRMETDAARLRRGWLAGLGVSEGARERERRLAAAIARVCVGVGVGVRVEEGGFKPFGNGRRFSWMK